jgi:hypothetical protein
MTPDGTELSPEKLLPGKARIFTYGYNCDKLYTLGDFLDHRTLERRAIDLLSSLRDPIHGIGKNEKGGDRPVVFFAHGYGGLVYEKVESHVLMQTWRIHAAID